MRGKIFGVALVTMALAACGDPATNDARGYTKAPLEDPDLLIRGEEATAMADLGEPIRPRPELVSEETEPSAEDEVGGQEAEQEVTLAPGVTREQYDQGRQLFGGQGGCLACHGADASGSQLGPDLTDAEWLHVSGPDVEALAQIITSGVAQPVEYPSPMPPMGGASLTPEQVRALAGYIASLNQG